MAKLTEWFVRGWKQAKPLTTGNEVVLSKRLTVISDKTSLHTTCTTESHIEKEKKQFIW